MVEAFGMTWLRRLPACLAAALFGFLVGSVGIPAATASEAGSGTLIARSALAPEGAADTATSTTAKVLTPTAPTGPTTAPTGPTTAPTVAEPVAVVEAAAATPTTSARNRPETGARTAAPAPAAEPTPAPESAPAETTPAPAPAAEPTPEERGAEALARIDYPWQRLGYSISFEGANPNLLGKADCGARQIFVYVRPTQTIQQIAFVTAFELGHAVDCGFMDDDRRAEWASIRGFAPGWTWFPGCVCAEDNYGSGDISMVFATWLVPDGGYRWRSNLAGPPSGDQLGQLMPYLRP